MRCALKNRSALAKMNASRLALARDHPRIFPRKVLRRSDRTIALCPPGSLSRFRPSLLSSTPLRYTRSPYSALDIWHLPFHNLLPLRASARLPKRLRVPLRYQRHPKYLVETERPQGRIVECSQEFLAVPSIPVLRTIAKIHFDRETRVVLA